MVAEKISREYEIPLLVAKQASETYLRKFRKCVENPLMDLEEWRIILWANALGEEYEELAEEIYVIWKRYRYKYLAVPETTLKLLRNFRKEYQLALVTNGPSNSQWEKVEELGIKDYFDAIVVSGDFEFEKPQPEIFHRTCDILGVQPYECLIVGDRIDTDIKGGHAAELGCTVWIPLVEPDQIPTDPSPDYTIRDISELQYILGRPRRNERSKSLGLSKPGKRTSSSNTTLPSSPGPSSTLDDEDEDTESLQGPSEVASDAEED